MAHCSTAGLPWRFVLALIVIISILPALTTAANSLNVINNCPYDLYYWVVGPDAPDLDETLNVVPAYSIATHQMSARSPYRNGGMAIKIRDLPHYVVAPSGIIQLEYTLDTKANYITWDLSAINCQRGTLPSNPNYCPFSEGGIKMYTNGQGSNEKSASCLGDQCFGTYTEHGSWFEEPSWPTAMGNDVFFETCTHGVGPRTLDDQDPDHVHVPNAPPPGLPSAPPLPDDSPTPCPSPSASPSASPLPDFPTPCPLPSPETETETETEIEPCPYIEEPPSPPAYDPCESWGPIPGCPNYVEPDPSPPCGGDGCQGLAKRGQ